MKITFIRSSTNAVGEYRVKHPMLALQALGHQTSMLTLGKEAERVYNHELAGDILVLCRQTSETVFDLIDILPPPMRPKIVYEVDDNPWEWHSWDPIHAELGYDYGNQVRKVMARCEAITCSTVTLAGRIKKVFPQMPIWVVPNAIDYPIRDWTAKEDRKAIGLEGKTVLGWTGSVHHTRDGGTMLQALPAIFDRYPDTVFLMQCDRSVYYQWTGGVLFNHYRDRLRWAPPVAFDWHPRIYSCFDINLAPLETTPFNVCKSDLRIIEGGSHGVPYVASKIAPYLEWHRASGGIGGHLATTPRDWIEGVGKLLDGEREGRGQSLARYVRETRALSVVAGTWQAAFEGVLSMEKGREVPPLERAGRNAPCPCGSGVKTKRCCEGAYA
jgi:hypothetical protein